MSAAAPPTLRLLELSALDADHVMAAFEAQPGLRYEAGQWINLHVQNPGEELDARALSFASAPSSLPSLEVCVRRKTGSQAVAALEQGVGRVFEFDGPYGAFRRKGPFLKPTIFVASSTGVAPIRGMLLDGARSGAPSVPGILLHARGADAVPVFLDQHAAWREAWPLLETHDVSSDQGDEQDPRTWEALVEQTRDALVRLGTGSVQVWMAGHAAWIKPLRAELRERWQLDRRQVKAEIFWP